MIENISSIPTQSLNIRTQKPKQGTCNLAFVGCTLVVLGLMLITIGRARRVPAKLLLDAKLIKQSKALVISGAVITGLGIGIGIMKKRDALQ